MSRCAMNTVWMNCWRWWRSKLQCMQCCWLLWSSLSRNSFPWRRRYPGLWGMSHMWNIGSDEICFDWCCSINLINLCRICSCIPTLCNHFFQWIMFIFDGAHAPNPWTGFIKHPIFDQTCWQLQDNCWWVLKESIPHFLVLQDLTV